MTPPPATPATSDADRAALPRVSGYRLMRPIGRGGQGEVFLAVAADALEKEVALKWFPPAGRSSYERELATARAIEAARRATRCEHLVESYAAGALDDGAAFIAMAFYTGGSLADRVAARGPLPEADAVAHARGALAALAVLHARGIVHGDVKPSNLFVGTDGVTALGDFGLARAGDATSSSQGAGGTAAFAAPEVLLGGRGGVAADVYGAGATLYWLLTAKPPFPARPDLYELERRGASRPLQKVLLRALREAPGDRFADAAAFAAALADAVPRGASPAALPRPAPAPTPGRVAERGRAGVARALRVAGAVVLVVLTARAVEAIRARAPAAEPSPPAASPSTARAPAPARPTDAVAPEPPPSAFPVAAIRRLALGASATAVIDADGAAWRVGDDGARTGFGRARRIAIAGPRGVVILARDDGTIETSDGARARPHADGRRIAAVAAVAGDGGALLVASASDAGDVVLLRSAGRDGLAPLGAPIAGDAGSAGPALAALAFDERGERLAIGRIATGEGAAPPRIAVHAVAADGIAGAPLAVLDAGVSPFADIAFVPGGGGALAVGLLDGTIAVVGPDASAPVHAVRAFAATLDWLGATPAGAIAAMGDDREARIVAPLEAPGPDEIIVLEDEDRRVLFPRTPRVVLRVFDAAALARGERVVRDERTDLPR